MSATAEPWSGYALARPRNAPGAKAGPAMRWEISDMTADRAQNHAGGQSAAGNIKPIRAVPARCLAATMILLQSLRARELVSRKLLSL